jgi:hypothetical protein
LCRCVMCGLSEIAEWRESFSAPWVSTACEFSVSGGAAL